MGCQYKSDDGTVCARNVHDQAQQLCYFHFLDKFEGGAFRLISEYIHDCNRSKKEIIDLSNKEFAGSRFPVSNLRGSKTVIFKGTRFINCDLSDWKFSSNDNIIEFIDCIFEDSKFNNCQIDCDSIKFSGSIFKGNQPIFVNSELKSRSFISFSDCSFEQEINPFESTRFITDIINLSRAYFKSYSLRIAFWDEDHERVEGNINESPRITCNSVWFKEFNYNGHFTLIDLRANKDQAIFFDFFRVNFATMMSATFIEINMTKTLIRDANVDNIYFIKPIWRQDEGGVRYQLYEEDRFEKSLRTKTVKFKQENKQEDNKDDTSNEKKEIYKHEEWIKDVYSELRRQYIQLKKNADDNREYETSNMWYHKEIECRRKMLKKEILITWKYENLTRSAKIINTLHGCAFMSLFVVYKITSRYGSNYLFPLLWLFGITISFGLLYWITGYTYNGTEVNFFWPLYLTDVSQIFVAFYKSVVFSLKYMFLLMSKDQYKLTNISELFPMIQPIFTALLVPTWLIAVRRKFKR